MNVIEVLICMFGMKWERLIIIQNESVVIDCDRRVLNVYGKRSDNEIIGFRYCPDSKELTIDLK
jgi:hypothetical protein